ncbi:DUF1801 domain-containing protein [Marinoscillum sp. MHG1-6]|uniref:DUF1801 domain-containing protein n=1 Tax=Marinoscillum sp. MHG1-6 TaxID=2959627 RepID=UPI002157226B|nr:DUF1801 domain-containing protein [Marinoscillum sp. MHG1-6]
MSDLKTTPNNQSVTEFLDAVPNETRKKDARAVLQLMKKITGKKPVMWGPSIVGFGTYHYKYASGREGDWFWVGFSPRKHKLVLYIMAGFGKYDTLMAQLGKYKTGVSCLYINQLSDINIDILRELITESVDFIKTKKW